MKDHRFMAKIYGVRGSYPVTPSSGTKYGGNTTCLFCRTKDHLVIFDAGTGIIQLGRDLVPEILAHAEKSKKPFHITLIFTHTHIDHLMGFPYFAPLFFPNVHLNFIGPATLGVDFEDILRTLVEPQYFPVSMDEFRSVNFFENIHENMVISFIEGVPEPKIGFVGQDQSDAPEMVIRNMKYYFHPKDGNYLYRIESGGHSLVFATDVEQYAGTDQRLIKFAEGCDVMIHDSQYTLEQYLKYQGYGHSNYKMACEAAIKAKAKKLLLFHHDPTNDDQTLEEIEANAKEIFSGAELAREGWEWKF
ncbi:MAG: MBL fold metallo-hydrolase [Calditrichales bacterium]|nr:MAG: MBL fold metallo-hydrolase [Calditrichales bacterium]